MTPTTFRREDLGDGMGSSNASHAADGDPARPAPEAEPSASLADSRLVAEMEYANAQRNIAARFFSVLRDIAEISGSRAARGFNEAGRLDRINEIASAALALPSPPLTGEAEPTEGGEPSNPAFASAPDEPHAQVSLPSAAVEPFQRYPALASWIERLGSTNMDLPLGDWMVFVGSLNAALSAAEGQRKSEWRTIDSAPRDGTDILLWSPGWKTVATGWTFGGDPWQGCRKDTYRNPPTHWQPLPPPPEPLS